MSHIKKNFQESFESNDEILLYLIILEIIYQKLSSKTILLIKSRPNNLVFYSKFLCLKFE